MRGIIALRKETKSMWERRVAFTPAHVRSLVNQGMTVLVQPSSQRCYMDSDYANAGAHLTTDLSAANAIFGIKEVPPHELVPNKLHVFFSHVRKAQPYNMPMLDAMLHKNVQLIDYECITDSAGERLVTFSEFAGNVGAIDFLQGLGTFLLMKRMSTPFVFQGYAYMYPWLSDAVSNLQRVAELIRTEGLPQNLVPFVMGVLGGGRVAQGVQQMLEHLPITYITPEQLVKGVTSDPTKIYVVVFRSQHVVVRQSDGGFDVGEYRQHPERYRSVFSERYLPHMSVLFNCLYWEEGFPRLVAVSDLQKNAGKLLGICDVSCDLKGSVEMCRKFTTPEDPFYLYRPQDDRIYSFREDHVPGSILMHSMDFLPSELPRDSSTHFGNALIQYAQQLSVIDSSKPVAEQSLAEELKRATIISGGSLTDRFAYITELRKKNPPVSAETKSPDSPSSLLLSDLEQVRAGQVLSSESYKEFMELKTKLKN